jgi:hypothetical protein
MNKLYENEVAFERANRDMARVAKSHLSSHVPSDLMLDVYCECANKLCQEHINVRFDEYVAAKHGLTFMVLPRHVLPEFEHVIRQTDEYWVIEKITEKLTKPFEL